MENEDINKAIAYLADKVSKYHERLLAVERDTERHIKNTDQHCCDDCNCKAEVDSEEQATGNCNDCGNPWASTKAKDVTIRVVKMPDVIGSGGEL